MTHAATRAVFERTAATYDSARAKLIPGFRDFYEAALSLLPGHVDRVLDLGAGTGLLAAFVRERFPAASLHLIDTSEAMLAQARRQFALDPKVLFQLGDYTSCSWGGSYDAIVSALSIHHLTDDAKKLLFARILASLRPGGLFINAEQVLQPSPHEEELARADWLARVRALGASEDQVAASLLRQTEDRCSTILDQLQWLNEAGFTEVRCPYAQGRFAVFAGTRESTATC